MSGQPRIVYVPGLKPKPPPDAHREVFWRCLVAGVGRANPAAAADMAPRMDRLRLVSWCHLFYPEYRDPRLDSPGIEALLAGDPRPATSALAPVRGLRWRLNVLGHRLGDRFPFLVGALASAATLQNLAETDRYFTDRDGAAARIRALLAAALAEAWSAGERVLLMAHSLGTVIAWDTLWELTRAGRAGPIDLFLTLGSPLGNRLIRSRLLGAGAAGADRFPAGIRRWHNLSAEGELTSLGHRFAEDYRAMVDAGLVGRITDKVDLVNPYQDTDGPNPHKCYGYFASAITGAVVGGWWRGEPGAP